MLQPLRWRYIECVIHHERDVRVEHHEIYVARTSNNRVIAVHDLCCCLLAQCEALRTCRSGFPIATVYRTGDMDLRKRKTTKTPPETPLFPLHPQKNLSRFFV